MKTAAVSATSLFVFAVFSFATLIGAPGTASACPARQDDAQSQPQTSRIDDQADAKTFTGKIVSLNGAMFILRDDANEVWYHLDDQAQAGKFAGKIVDVKGTLDGPTDTIHVQSIAAQNGSPSSGASGR
jgi:hypothetical protein